jgi:membrane protein
VRQLLRFPIILHRAALRALEHDLLNLAQSSAYSAMVALFPALLISAAIITLLPDAAPVRAQLGGLFERVLPPDILPMLGAYFDATPHKSKSARVLVLSFIVSISGAASVISTYMEGFRRANDLPFNCWTFWARRARSYALVPLSVVPFTLASSLIVFGQIITRWVAGVIGPPGKTEIYALALILRWGIALIGCIGLIALIYHMGTPIRQPWRKVLPGAIAATLIWFLTTLAFGWYVTRFANYSQVYGSLGAGIALLFWLFLVSLSILFGSEFNYVYWQHHPHPVSS